MSSLAHHGFIYVPLGYKTVFKQLTNIDELHGGSPWGAGTFAVSPCPHLKQPILTIYEGSNGSRQPSALELEVAFTQGKSVYELAVRTNFA